MQKSQPQSIDFDPSFILTEDLLETPRLQMRVFTETPTDGVTWHAGYSDPYLVINTRGTFLCTREAAKRISDDGRIINIATSLLAGMAPNYAGYAGTKAPMEEITRMVARELGDRGITVNAISPGPIDTPFFHGQETPESTKFAANLAVAGRLGKIDDIVPLVEFLALPGAQWITGQTIWINGGYLTR